VTLIRNTLIAGICLGLIGGAVFEWEAVRLREIRIEQAALGRLTQRAQLASGRMADQLATARSHSDSAPSAEPPPRPAAEISSVGTPEELRRQAVRDHAKLDLNFAPLYRSLHLSKAQSDAVTARFAVFQTHRADILVAAEGQGLTRSDPAINALILEESARLQSDLTGIMGPDDFNQWKAYRQNDAVRGIEKSLASNLYYTDEPLSAAQADQLTPLLAQLRVAGPNGQVTALPITEANAAQLRAAGAAVLSPGQLASFNDLLAGWQASEQLTTLLHKQK
jgi:hypothetical protein